MIVIPVVAGSSPVSHPIFSSSYLHIGASIPKMNDTFPKMTAFLFEK